MDKNKLKGGFSAGVFDSYEFQDYIEDSPIFGWIGSRGRSRQRDRIVESALRERGLGDSGIATWLTSTDGRHLGDASTCTKSLEEFKEIVSKYADRARIQVFYWSHPDCDYNGEPEKHLEWLQGIIKMLRAEERSKANFVAMLKERDAA